MMQAMRIMGELFVLGRTMDEALKRGARQVRKGEARALSFDMPGEGARTHSDARRYFESYAGVIAVLAKANAGSGPEAASAISVKHSALHSAYRPVQGARVHAELYPMLLQHRGRARSRGEILGGFSRVARAGKEAALQRVLARNRPVRTNAGASCLRVTLSALRAG